MTEVVEARLTDIPELCPLLDALFAQEAEFHPDRAAQERGLAMIIGDSFTGRVLILREGGRAVGMANLLFTVSTALGERVAWLEDVVVAPDARGRGLGGVLMKGVERCALANGCKRLTLLTDGDNAAAQRFYERHDFVRSTMLPMRRLL